MEDKHINALVLEWDDVYKKGQLSLWVLLAIFDGKKYAAEISEFMYGATGGTFEVKEQSLYRALRRFKAMGMVGVTEEESPNSGPKRKVYHLTESGKVVLGAFVDLHIAPLLTPKIMNLLQDVQLKGKNSEYN